MEARSTTWFHPVSRTAAQISETAERQLCLWGTELTTEQVVLLTSVIAALRGAIVSFTRSAQLEVVLSLAPGSAVTVEMVDRTGSEIPSSVVRILNSSSSRWGVAPMTSGPGRVLWAEVEVTGASRVSEVAMRLARTPHGRALRRVLPAPLERTARRWLAA